MAPFDPLYLGNGKSYVKSICKLPKEILVRNFKKKKKTIKIVQKINTLYPEVWNYHFQPIWASSFPTGTCRPPIFYPILYTVVRIIVFKFHGNWSTWTKVIARKPCVYRRTTTTELNHNIIRPQNFLRSYKKLK